MLHERTINVIMVSENKAVKLDFGRVPDKSIIYSGEEIKVKFE